MAEVDLRRIVVDATRGARWEGGGGACQAAPARMRREILMAKSTATEPGNPFGDLTKMIEQFKLP
jgi:hypothetical protein